MLGVEAGLASMQEQICDMPIFGVAGERMPIHWQTCNSQCSKQLIMQEALLDLDQDKQIAQQLWPNNFRGRLSSLLYLSSFSSRAERHGNLVDFGVVSFQQSEAFCAGRFGLILAQRPHEVRNGRFHVDAQLVFPNLFSL